MSEIFDDSMKNREKIQIKFAQLMGNDTFDPKQPYEL